MSTAIIALTGLPPDTKDQQSYQEKLGIGVAEPCDRAARKALQALHAIIGREQKSGTAHWISALAPHRKTGAASKGHCAAAVQRRAV